jgi:tryptophanyl-tRNA synthetase
MNIKKNILSAIQPTGEVHLGNYLGAIQNWLRLQEEYNCVYGVVDYHAMTMPYHPETLRKNSYNMVVNLLACGIKPENIFIQSLVPEHTELAWILNCLCSYGDLTRQTQFKDKTQQLEDVSSEGFISAGLFTYPVLQAADILMYHPHFVPVGKDQEQHIELSRTIANRFNHQFQTDYFEEPKVLFTETPKIQSLADPTKKMSKSLGDRHYIALFEDEAGMRKKIKSAVTDAGDTPEGEMSAGVQNIFGIILALGNKPIYDDLMAEYLSGAKMYGKLKEGLAETVVNFTNELKENRANLLEDRDLPNKIKAASEEIRKRARKTVDEVREIVGLAK